MFLLANKMFIKTCYTSVKASIKIIKTDKENFVPILDEETCTLVVRNQMGNKAYSVQAWVA
jgi:hypothetical protein